LDGLPVYKQNKSVANREGQNTCFRVSAFTDPFGNFL